MQIEIDLRLANCAANCQQFSLGAYGWKGPTKLRKGGYTYFRGSLN